jgi:hypothetical protein
MEKAKLPNHKVKWAMGRSGNVLKNAVKVGEALIAEDNPEAKQKTTARNPFPSGYKPKFDNIMPKLNDELGLRILQLFRILLEVIRL